MAGGHTLGDIYKMDVYGLAEVFNRRAIGRGQEPPVNDSTMTKPPSAELAPDDEMMIRSLPTMFSIKSFASIAEGSWCKSDRKAWIRAGAGCHCSSTS